MMDCVRQTIRNNGVRGPFQGLGATLLRDTPANSIYLGSFEVRRCLEASFFGCVGLCVVKWIMRPALL